MYNITVIVTRYHIHCFINVCIVHITEFLLFYWIYDDMLLLKPQYCHGYFFFLLVKSWKLYFKSKLRNPYQLTLIMRKVEESKAKHTPLIIDQALQETRIPQITKYTCVYIYSRNYNDISCTLSLIVSESWGEQEKEDKICKYKFCYNEWIKMWITSYRAQ